MKKMRDFLCVFLMAVLPLPLLATPIQAGNQYTIMEKKVQNAPDVVEFFSFYCSPCAVFAGRYGVSKAVEKVLPEGRRIEKYHVAAMGELGEELTKAWSVAKLLGVEPLVEMPLFAAVQEKKSIKSEADIRQVFIDSGIPGKQYDAAIHSLAVKSLIIKQKQAVDDYNVSGTPAFYIKGKYLVKNAGIGSATVDEYAKSFANVVGELLRGKDK